MAEERYYWLKLQRDFFKRHDVRIVESMQNGKDYVLFYLKLLCESIDHEGRLRFNDSVPYNDDMLSIITNTNIDIVRSAVKIFTELGLMELQADGTFYMNEVEKMIGSAAGNAHALRQRRYIENKKQKMLNSPDKNTESVTNSDGIVTDDVTNSDESKSKSKSKSKRKNIYSSATAPDVPSSRFQKPTVEEIREYCLERKNHVDPQNFYDFYEAKGWMVGKNHMKDWRASVRTWERSSAEESTASLLSKSADGSDRTKYVDTGWK